MMPHNCWNVTVLVLPLMILCEHALSLNFYPHLNASISDCCVIGIQLLQISFDSQLNCVNHEQALNLLPRLRYSVVIFLTGLTTSLDTPLISHI